MISRVVKGIELVERRPYMVAQVVCMHGCMVAWSSRTGREHTKNVPLYLGNRGDFVEPTSVVLISRSGGHVR